MPVIMIPYPVTPGEPCTPEDLAISLMICVSIIGVFLAGIFIKEWLDDRRKTR